MTKARIVEILENELYLGRHHPSDYHPAIMGVAEAADAILAAQSAAPAGMTSANLAALIHEARFPEGKDAPNYTPFLHEDRNGREYCLRIARKILECCALYPVSAAPPPSPPEVVGWQDISTAPRNGTHILCYHPKYDMVLNGVWDGGDLNCFEMKDERLEYVKDFYPTHWMPLPKGPSHEG